MQDTDQITAEQITAEQVTTEQVTTEQVTTEQEQASEQQTPPAEAQPSAQEAADSGTDSGKHPRARLDAALFELSPEEEADELAADERDRENEQKIDAAIDEGLAIYPWFKQVRLGLQTQFQQAETQQKQAKVQAQRVLDTLSAEDREAIEQWVGSRDRMQQAQGARSAASRLTTPLHNLDAGLSRARRELSKTRHERNRIKTVALDQGVRLSRKLMGRKKKKA